MDKSENVMFTTTSSSYDARVHSPDNEIHAYHDGDDVFGHEQHSTIKYKTLSWQIVSILMIAEIVSNGMLSLPSSLAVVGLAPGLILIIFLGAFAAYTSLLLVRFKLRHPSVHNMGDAGQILFGAFGREIFAFGTLFFAVLLAGGQMLSGQIALAKLSENGLCNISFTGLFAAATFLCALPRTYDYLGWISMASVGSIVVAGIVGMIGAGLHPVEKAEREVVAARSSDFQTAFFSITNPVFAYCGHFMFACPLFPFPLTFFPPSMNFSMEIPPFSLKKTCLNSANIPFSSFPFPPPSQQVLRPHVRNENPSRRHQSRLHPPNLRNNLLLPLRRNHLRLPRQQRRLALILLLGNLLVQSRVWDCAAEFADCGRVVCAHGE